MTGPAAEKARLRPRLRQRARELPAGYCTQADRDIAGHLFRSPAFQRAKSVFCFVGRAGEIDTRPILSRVLDLGHTLCVPLCVGPGQMEARALTSLEDLEPGQYGILEPRPDRCPLIPARSLALALVPCLSATRQGLRLGQGGGYYDRYLAGAEVPAILLCREEMLSESLPAESWDLGFDWLLTEKGFWHRGRRTGECSVLG